MQDGHWTKVKNGIVVFALIWLGLLFGTSCTVIRPHEFFGLVQSFTGVDSTSMQRFQLFWGLSWFAIVKGWHFTEFAVLLLLCVGAIRCWRRPISSWSIVGAMSFCVVFAASDEWHQSFVPDRFGTIQDVLIDSLGVCTAGAVLLFRHRRHTFSVSEPIGTNGPL